MIRGSDWIPEDNSTILWTPRVGALHVGLSMAVVSRILCSAVTCVSSSIGRGLDRRMDHVLDRPVDCGLGHRVFCELDCPGCRLDRPVDCGLGRAVDCPVDRRLGRPVDCRLDRPVDCGLDRPVGSRLDGPVDHFIGPVVWESKLGFCVGCVTGLVG